MTDLSYSDSSTPPPSKKQAFTVNCIISLNIWSIRRVLQPKASGIQKHSYQAEYYKDSELISQELAKGQSWRYAFFWECTRFEQHRPAELTLYFTRPLNKHSQLFILQVISKIVNSKDTDICYKLFKFLLLHITYFSLY